MNLSQARAAIVEPFAVDLSALDADELALVAQLPDTASGLNAHIDGLTYHAWQQLSCALGKVRVVDAASAECLSAGMVAPVVTPTVPHTGESR